jgi:hypothetical protein
MPRKRKKQDFFSGKALFLKGNETLTTRRRRVSERHGAAFAKR